MTVHLGQWMRFGAIVLVAAIVATGCSTTSSDKVLLPINVADAQQLLSGQKKLLGIGGTTSGAWVDSRPDSDYRTGHIPGAINLPYERVTLDHKMLDKYDVVVVYGADYGDSRADAMSKRLKELGHDDVRTLIGGLRAWKQQDNPVETSQ